MRSSILATALIFMLKNGEIMARQHEVSKLVESVALASPYWRRFLDKKSYPKASGSKETYYFPKSTGKFEQNPVTDLGILTANHDSREHHNRHLFNFHACLDTCTNEDFCACRTEFNYSCPYVNAKVCSNPDELKMCIDDSNRLALASYLYCPMNECLDVLTIKEISHSFIIPMATQKCLCEAYTAFCQECEKKNMHLCDMCEYWLDVFCAEIMIDSTESEVSQTSPSPPRSHSTASEVSQALSSAVYSAEKWEPFDSASPGAGTFCLLRNGVVLATSLFAGFFG